jgi:hypothetical protein
MGQPETIVSDGSGGGRLPGCQVARMPGCQGSVAGLGDPAVVWFGECFGCPTDLSLTDSSMKMAIDTHRCTVGPSLDDDWSDFVGGNDNCGLENSHKRPLGIDQRPCTMPNRAAVAVRHHGLLPKSIDRGPLS